MWQSSTVPTPLCRPPAPPDAGLPQDPPNLAARRSSASFGRRSRGATCPELSGFLTRVTVHHNGVQSPQPFQCSPDWETRKQEIAL